MIQMKLPAKQKQTHRHPGQTCGCQRAGGRGGKDWEVGPSRCELLDPAGVPSIPSPWALAGAGLWPIGNRARLQEVSGGRVSTAPSVCSCSPSLTLLPESHPLSDQQQDNKCNTPETSGTAQHHQRPGLPSLWNSCLPRNKSLVPKRMGTTDIYDGYTTRHYCIAQRTVINSLSIKHDEIDMKHSINKP